MDTCYYTYIQGSIYLSIGSTGFDICVKEVGRDFSFCKMEKNMKLKDVGGVVSPEKKVEGENCSMVKGGEKEVLVVNSHCNDCNCNDDLVGSGFNFEIMGNSDPIDCLRTIIRNDGAGNIKLHQSNDERTIGLEDDRRTEEVLRDLGVLNVGPNI